MSSLARSTRRRVAGERSRSRSPESTPQSALASALESTPESTPAPDPAVWARQQRPTPRHAPAVEPRGARAEAEAETAPEALPPGGPVATPADRPERRRTQRSRRMLVPAIALALAVLLLGGVAGLSLAAPSGQAGQTRAATSAARTAIEQMLSYNHASIDAQAARVETLLTGAFKKEFTDAMDSDIKPLAVKNRTVVQAKVSDIGVMEQAEGRVKVLAFVNQATVGADQKQPAIDQNRVIATLSKVGDRWLVSDVQAF